MRQYHENSNPKVSLTDMLTLLRISKSKSAKVIAFYLEIRKEFFEYINLGVNTIEIIAESDEKTAEAKVAEVFPYGWLDPNGKFVPVPISEHEKLVKQFTGFTTCDAACKAGWIKGYLTTTMATVCSRNFQIAAGFRGDKRNGLING